MTSVEVEGLTPFLNYTFSVTTENAVSSQDSDVTGRTTNTIATTEEGGIYIHACQRSFLYIDEWVDKRGRWTVYTAKTAFNISLPTQLKLAYIM